MSLSDLLPLYSRVDTNNPIRYKYHHKHLVFLSCLVCLLILFLFNIQFTLHNTHSDNTSYLILIHSKSQYHDRRSILRREYFNIHNNLLPPCLSDSIQYRFLMTDGHPPSNTVERRLFETEKIEYNDIIELNRPTLKIPSDLLKEIDASLWNSTDYVIIQDIHSFIPLSQLIDEVSRHGDIDIWGSDMDGIVIRSSKISSMLFPYKSSNDDHSLVLPNQEWKNSIESVEAHPLLIKHVYQDEDFLLLRDDYMKHKMGVTLVAKCQPPSIAIVTSSYIYDKCMEPSATMAAMNKRKYADKHGYAFVARSNEFRQQSMRPDVRRTVWGKIDIIQKILPKYEWLMWVDMDAVVMNDDQSIEALMDGWTENEADFIIVRPGTDKMINAGVFLIKNTEWSYGFLDRIQSSAEWYIKGPSYEQGAMWDVMQEHGERVLFLDRQDHVFNTFPKYYQPGDFIVHFAPDKCPNDATLKGLRAADKIRNGEVVTSKEL
ncbi:hypothetical protein BDB01DRAFT_816563 [Pilobolus umbonatus]|nr:hypothetical protein BDB01DRAFT_816563 [Pilobolus umbonatus]